MFLMWFQKASPLLKNFKSLSLFLSPCTYIHLSYMWNDDNISSQSCTHWFSKFVEFIALFASHTFWCYMHYCLCNHTLIIVEFVFKRLWNTGRGNESKKMKKRDRKKEKKENNKLQSYDSQEPTFFSVFSQDSEKKCDGKITCFYAINDT